MKKTRNVQLNHHQWDYTVSPHLIGASEIWTHESRMSIRLALRNEESRGVTRLKQTRGVRNSEFRWRSKIRGVVWAKSSKIHSVEGRAGSHNALHSHTLEESCSRLDSSGCEKGTRMLTELSRHSPKGKIGSLSGPSSKEKPLHYSVTRQERIWTLLLPAQAIQLSMTW